MPKLKELCFLITDGEHGSVKDDKTGSCFLLSNKNLNNGFITIDDNDRRIGIETKNKLNKRTKIGKNTILISTVGTIGKLAFINDDNINYSFQRSVGIIKPNVNLINPYFLYSLLQTREYQERFGQMASGSVQKCIFISGLEELDIKDYAIDKQNKIGKTFFDIDGLIKNNVDIINSLTNKIKDIFTYWFVDYNFPDSCGNPYKKNGGVFGENKLPIGWTYMPFTDNSLFKLVPVGIDIFKGNKIYLSTSQVTQDNYDLNANIITYEKRESRANMQPVINSVWFARMKKSVKHLCFDDSGYLVNDLILSTGFCGVFCDSINLEYVYSVINSSWFEETKDVYSSGSTQESITDLILSYIKIKIPNKNIIEQFHNATKNDLKAIQKLKHENDVLIKYKSFLLETLFK